ncbi:3-hydroxybutyryl-CoA dehydrogenase [Virgisporangium aliadipatigenens]|uniref:3-hydroxybutyryl-CoA dehydrogenase n=1 Tax=Virgisporangium aliadipatigenens TaxID=741659 RepID=A0A8J4DS39_9ACTN|nr:3-hydroxyacyl-CoA dehydrogenase NAD-binding domain-containing protein [Virgisporangium aliadipatigenens]GIJ48805.1 3-hydroxybutyryl-CoA dehydrogenase [Virgisporangium aliadipatigenens]
MKRIGVIGAGVMGTGVAQNLAAVGLESVLVDVDDATLERARQQIQRGARMSRLLSPAGANGARSPEPNLDLIHYTTDYTELGDVDFVVENITEKWDLKSAIYPRLDAICAPGVVFAANTSAISITRLASLTTRPERVLGMHFMNPVPMKPAVEVIRGWHTSDETVRTAQELLARMGKEGIVVADAPGFVSNRVLMLTVNEAVYLVQDGVAPAADVDRVFKSCFGHPMGPLETADLIGLDTILHSVEVLYESFNDSKYRPCPLLRKMVDAGLYGRKSGQGFYTYS